MTDSIPSQFDGVSIVCKANVYFDGKVISHAILFEDGSKKTIGLIYPGTYKFGTGDPEQMDLVSGSCRIKLAGDAEWTDYTAGSSFKVPGQSSFEIVVDEGLLEYICSYG